MAKQKQAPVSDVYTAILALASLTVLATATFAAVMCYVYYETLNVASLAAR